MTRGQASAGFVLVLLAGCATTTPTATKSQSELLPNPGARIELREVTNDSGQSFEVDVVELLREAMDASLRKEELAWAPGSPSTHFTLSLAIREYNVLDCRLSDHRPISVRLALADQPQLM